MPSPFAPSTSRPGHGTVVLSLLPPSTPVLSTLTYQYPLKLIAPAPITLSTSTSAHEPPDETTIHTLYLLTYGGGLVAGDTIALNLALSPHTRLILLTQGTTKIFKSPSRAVGSAQRMRVSVAPGAGLCYLPDPVQPFAGSVFGQRQEFRLLGGGEGEAEAEGSLCVLDWVCEGRRARGESWGFWGYTSRNEVWAVPVAEGEEMGAGEEEKIRRKGSLLLRDNVILEDDGHISGGLVARVDGLGVFGTLILRGKLFEGTGWFFMDEFEKLPRIGGRKWDTGEEEKEMSDEEKRRLARQKQETEDGLLWTAANIRGFVLVKFGARELEGAKRWLRHMFVTEGSVEREFGERALFCLK